MIHQAFSISKFRFQCDGKQPSGNEFRNNHCGGDFKFHLPLSSEIRFALERQLCIWRGNPGNICDSRYDRSWEQYSHWPYKRYIIAIDQNLPSHIPRLIPMTTKLYPIWLQIAINTPSSIANMIRYLFDPIMRLFNRSHPFPYCIISIQSV